MPGNLEESKNVELWRLTISSLLATRRLPASSEVHRAAADQQELCVHVSQQLRWSITDGCESPNTAVTISGPAW